MRIKNILYFILYVMCCPDLFSQELLNLSLEQAENLAIENNYKIHAGLHRLEQRYYAYRTSKDHFLPSLALSAQWNVAQEGHGLDNALRLTQSLYDQTACYQLKEAQIQWEFIRFEVQQQICDTLLQVREAYDEVVLNQAQLAVDSAIIQIWEEELKRQESHLALGTLIAFEINQTRLQLKNAWIDYYDTQKKMRISQYKLLTLLGQTPGTVLSISENDLALPPQKGQMEATVWKEWSLQYSPELKQEQFNFLLSQVKIKQVKAENIPTVSLYANAGHRYVNNGFDHQPYVGVGVAIDWTLFNPARQHQMKQAQAGKKEALANYYQVELENEAAIYSLLSELEQSYHVYAVAHEGSLLAQEGINIATKKHQIGQLTTFEYRDTIKTLREAEQKINQAKFELRRTYYRLKRQVGIDLRTL